MLKLIADTSIWVDFFKGKLPTIISNNFKTSLDNDQVVITDIIAHELFVGTKSKKDYQEMFDLLSTLLQLRIQENQLQDFNLFAWKLSHQGLRGKYTDISIAYLSYHYNYPVLSLDHYFNCLAEKEIIKIVQF